MSTLTSIGQIQSLRSEVVKVNADLQLLTRLAVDGRVAAYDFLTLSRLITGGSGPAAELTMYLNSTIMLLQAAGGAVKAFGVTLAANPWFWPLLAVGTFVGIVAADQMMRRP